MTCRKGPHLIIQDLPTPDVGYHDLQQEPAMGQPAPTSQCGRAATPLISTNKTWAEPTGIWCCDVNQLPSDRLTQSIANALTMPSAAAQTAHV